MAQDEHTLVIRCASSRLTEVDTEFLRKNGEIFRLQKPAQTLAAAGRDNRRTVRLLATWDAASRTDCSSSLEMPPIRVT